MKMDVNAFNLVNSPRLQLNGVNLLVIMIQVCIGFWKESLINKR